MEKIAEAEENNDPISELMRRREWRDAAAMVQKQIEAGRPTPQKLERLVICLTNGGMFDAVAELAAGLRSSPLDLPRIGHHTHGLAFLRRPPDNPHQDYLFVSGAPRSGTSSLGAFLSWQTDIAMFTERYRPYLGYHPNMFKLWAIYHGNHKHKHAAQHQGQRGKLGAAKWIGDKRPNFAYGLPFTLPNFEGRNLVILHVVRDPYDVCWSYENLSGSEAYFRAGYKFACDEINANNQALLRHARHYHVVDFAKLYEGPEGVFAIYDRLGLEASDDLKAHAIGFYERSRAALTTPRKLAADVRNYIENAIDWDAHHELLARAI